MSDAKQILNVLFSILDQMHTVLALASILDSVIRNRRKKKKNQKPLLVLDLDNTVICAKPLKTENSQFSIVVGRKRMYIEVRPFVAEFLDEVSALYDICFFTDANGEFAKAVISKIAPSVNLKTCKFKESCTFTDGYVVKDLSILGRPMNQVVLVDDSIGSGLMQPLNCIGVTAWDGEINDRVLVDELLPVLMKSAQCENVARNARNMVLDQCMNHLSVYKNV